MRCRLLSLEASPDRGGESLVLLGTILGPAHRSFDDSGRAEPISRDELLFRQVNFFARRQPIPVVDTERAVRARHIGDEEFAAEPILYDEGGRATLASGGVVGAAGSHIGR
jgi:hypothetical protein